ncbi:MAG: nucleotidyltransferase family protein [Gaiellaceae bacterium]
MKALLLAAGLGSRLRPLTDAVPKCLLPVAGKSTLLRAVELLRGQGVTDLIVNLHHRPETVVAVLGDGRALGVRVEYSHEPELLGTAGALDACRDRLDGRFLVLFADNVYACDLDDVLTLHERHGATLTMALHRRDDARQSGWAEVDEDGRVARFVEKPEAAAPFGGWVNAGLLVCEQGVLKAVPRGVSSDFGRDVVPALLAAGEPVAGYRMAREELLLWIDTPADLDRAAETLRAREAVA